MIRRRTRLKGKPLARRGTRKSPLAKPSKFGNVSCTYNGYTYDSRAEARHAAWLDSMRKCANPAMRVMEVKRQVSMPLYALSASKLNGVRVCSHVVDFLVYFADCHHEFHEVKGYETAVWNLKRKLFLANYPFETYVVVRPNGHMERANA